jgi:bifunctional non-homologous end joining protein LigD
MSTEKAKPKPPARPRKAAAAQPVPPRSAATSAAEEKAPAPVADGLTDAAGIAAAENAGVHFTSPDRVEYPAQGVTKGMLAAYYAAVAERILPYIADRPLSLVRCPQGAAKACFFQKHDSGGFPAQMKKLPVAEKDGKVEDYFYVDDLAGIIAGVQMNVLEFHLWGSKRDAIEKPERIIFDIDPDVGLDFGHVKDAARDIRDVLDALGLESFPLLSGGKGIHVIAPLKPGVEWPEVKAFCKGVADKLATTEPDRFVSNMAKAKRVGRMFIDYLRNERGATAISPWSTRSRDGAPCAVPVSWGELSEITAANSFNVAGAAKRARGADPWKGYFDRKQGVTAAMLRAVSASG